MNPEGVIIGQHLQTDWTSLYKTPLTPWKNVLETAALDQSFPKCDSPGPELNITLELVKNENRQVSPQT